VACDPCKREKRLTNAATYASPLLALLCHLQYAHCVFVAVEYWKVSRSESPNTQLDSKLLLPAALAVLYVAIFELQGAAGAPTMGDVISFSQPIEFGMGYLTLEELMRKNLEAALLPVSAVAASHSFSELLIHCRQTCLY
jgi:hypothetical protein